MSLSILVVDDEPDVADLFRRRFRRESRQGTYVMHFATSGVEALDRLAEEIQPTLVAVLSDINMPGMDGLELLGEIKQRHPNLPEGGAAAEGATNEAQVDLLYRQIGATLFNLAKQFQPIMPGILMSDRTATSAGWISPASRSRASGPEVAKCIT